MPELSSKIFHVHKEQPHHTPMASPAAAITAAANEPKVARGEPPVDVEEPDELDVAFPPDAGSRGTPVVAEPEAPSVLATLQSTVSHRFVK